MPSTLLDKIAAPVARPKTRYHVLFVFALINAQIASVTKNAK